MQAPPNLHKGIAIGIASNGRGVPVEWAVALATQAWPLNVTLHYIHSRGLETGEARNAIVEQALKANVKYIWFLDDDTVPESNACRKLVHELELNPQAAICGGIYCDKQNPPMPLVFREWGEGSAYDWVRGEVFPCVGIATGCMLVRASVFEDLPRPWFKTVSEVPEDGSAARLTMTDDLWFCKRVAEAGHTILAHGGVLCEHHDLATGIVYRLPTRVAT